MKAKENLQKEAYSQLLEQISEELSSSLEMLKQECSNKRSINARLKSEISNLPNEHNERVTVKH